MSEGHPKWGWRTEIDDPDGDALAIRMINRTPDGQEAPSVFIDLTRAR